MRLRTAVIAASLVLVAPAAAQPAPGSPTPRPDSLSYERARTLVSDGYGAKGRTLVDSLLAAAAPGTPAYAEALYWRATLAERAADSERDYRQLAVDFAASPRAADALVRLAQLDLVRGDPAAARGHLARLLRDRTDAPTRARAHYWLARASLDAADARSACESLNEAAAAAAPGGDLARQIVALRGRVARCTLRVAIGGGPPSSVVVPAAAAPPDARVASGPPPNDAPPRPTPASTPPRLAPAAAVGHGYTVQVAAYDGRASAEGLAARLAKRGHDARVESGGATPDSPPFRVRIGRWATRAEALAALAALRTRGLSGFVAESGPNAAATR